MAIVFANEFREEFGLKTKMTHNIGVLFIDDYHSGLTHPYFAPVLESLKTEVENLGYDITFINKNVGGREMSYLEHCRYRNVDGVVIANVDFTKEEVEAAIDALGKGASVRGETLTLEEFARLSDLLSPYKKG